MSDLSASLGMPLDEWQESALEAAMGERSDGRWASKFIGISAPRQNGKSQLIVARALAGVLLFGEKTIIISAHETDTAREIWKRMIDVIEDNPTLEARVSGRMDAINREYLAFGKGKDRQTIRLKARGASGSRGFSADCLLLDEGQILGKRAWGAIVPTMSARENPQLWLFGTPPTEQDDPFAFSRVRESSLKKKARHCWLEWSADPSDDFDDPETWAKANPSFGVRISAEACADDRAAMDNEQFGMERLGIWSAESSLAVFGEGRWGNCRGDVPDDRRPGAVGVAVSVDLSSAAVVLAARSDGRVLPLPVAHGPGTDWVIDHAVSSASEYRVPIIIDGGGPAAFLVDPLRKAARAKGVRVVEATFGQMKDACAAIYLQVQAEELLHDSWPEMDAAVAGAVQRKVGDRWLWGRRGDRKSTKPPDISPLEAATVALWGQDNVRTQSAADQRLSEGGPAVMSI